MGDDADRPLERVHRLAYCRHCQEETPRDSSRACMPCSNRRASAWRAKNREHVRAAAARRAAARKERDPEAVKERARRHGQNRRAKLAGGDVTADQLRAKFEAADGKCTYCGQPIPEPHCFMPSSVKGFDHVVALAHGGRHTIDNMVPCCFPCNREKAKAEVSALLRKHNKGETNGQQ